jgi:hypothetical protein
MRYVVLIVVLVTFAIWDVTQNNSRFIQKAGRFVIRQIETVL